MIDTLFSGFSINDLFLKNRIVMSPMCQYSAREGMPNEWHKVHYASRAIGGAGLITIEMTAVSPEGRSTDKDLGLWSDKHIPKFEEIISLCKKNGAKVSVQISHAGRKAQNINIPISPSAIKFEGEMYNQPRELEIDDIKKIIDSYTQTAKRAVLAGADCIEIHGAHGYLIHQFHSRLTNKRNDKYGVIPWKFGTEVIQSVKNVIPKSMPLIMRISAIEYAVGGYDIEYVLKICEHYRNAGISIFSISSGGEGPFPTDYPGHHVPFSRVIKGNLRVPTIVAGVINSPDLADSIIRNNDADLIAIGRGMLRNPYWALDAAEILNQHIEVPDQYKRAFN
nr:NADPH dehydrogenase [Robertmurraya kyonggiensis]